MAKAVILDFYGVLYSNFDWKVIEERIKPDPVKAKRFEELKEQSNRGEITNRYLQTAVPARRRRGCRCSIDQFSASAQYFADNL